MKTSEQIEPRILSLSNICFKYYLIKEEVFEDLVCSDIYTHIEKAWQIEERFFY